MTTLLSNPLASRHLQDQYNQLWEQSLEKFQRREFEFDSHINAGQDKRYGLTLRAQPSEAVRASILSALDEIKPIAPQQYYYPQSDLHLTILSIISCFEGFTLEAINLEAYQQIIASAVHRISPFKIHFRGLTASPSCILIQGFPENAQLTNLRDALRRAFKASDLQHSIDQRYRLQTAHMTVLRFAEPFSATRRFVSKIIELRDRDFGSCQIDAVELVGNDWYHQQARIETVGRFSLSG